MTEDVSITDHTHLKRHQLTNSFGLAMFLYDNTSCALNCSGHGDCYNGTCFCEVEFNGESCKDPNLRFYIAFSTVFYVICAVSFMQLVLCIKSEFSRQKPRSLVSAFRITTQKALYFFICVATAMRGFYFSSPDIVSLRWAESLMSAYYPVLLSGSSLLVCFWAEHFHLHNVSVETPGFLSKSFTGFILFNVLTYSLLVAECILLLFSDPSDVDKSLFLSIFNSIYALLILVVVIFFLIYGVEVYFKVRGAFIREETWPADFSQLQQSRLGLVSHAVLLLITVLFLFSEVLGAHWKDKVPVFSRNYHQIMFRVVELGAALWFPCVLWNCFRPETLWILNPRRILKREPTAGQVEIREFQRAEAESLVGTSSSATVMKNDKYNRAFPECWICYDSERKDVGPLIQPCACKGDVSAVHHDCLKKWLMDSYSNPDNVKCKVCDEYYQIQRGQVWLHTGLTISHYFKSAAILSIMCSAAACTFLVVRIFVHPYVRTISVGCAILVEYICLRFLGFNMLSGYHRAKFAAVKIIGQKITHGSLGSTHSSKDAHPHLHAHIKSMSTVSQSIPVQQICTNSDSICNMSMTKDNTHDCESSGNTLIMTTHSTVRFSQQEQSNEHEHDHQTNNINT